MIPEIQLLTTEIQDVVYPNDTYKIEVTTTEPPTDRINGNAYDLESLQQSIYLILGTERYQHIIYSFDYGVELADLFGKPVPYVLAILPTRIKDALKQDNRIEDVVDFEFDVKRGKVHATFRVISTVGDVPAELEVDI